MLWKAKFIVITVLLQSPPAGRLDGGRKVGILYGRNVQPVNWFH